MNRKPIHPEKRSIPKKKLPPTALERFQARGIPVPIIFTTPPEIMKYRRGEGQHVLIQVEAPAPGLLAPRSFSRIRNVLTKKINQERYERETARSESQSRRFYKTLKRPGVFIERLLKVMK